LLFEGYRLKVSAMTSTLNLSRNDDAKGGVSPALVSAQQELGTDWESLRGLTNNTYQPDRSTKALPVLLAVLLIVGLASLGLVLRSHIPGLVTFGEELSETVHQLVSASPTPSTATRGTALPELRATRKQPRSSRVRIAESQPDQEYDPAFHPFYATAVVGGRRVALVSSHGIVVLDMDNGTWKFGAELE
jgi:hypothetical protein